MSDMADVLGELWDAGNCTGLDGWIGPGRGAGEVDDYALQTRERDVAKALAALTATGFGPVQETPRQESCPTRLMDGRNEIRCWLTAGHEGDHK